MKNIFKLLKTSIVATLFSFLFSLQAAQISDNNVHNQPVGNYTLEKNKKINNVFLDMEQANWNLCIKFLQQSCKEDELMLAFVIAQDEKVEGETGEGINFTSKKPKLSSTKYMKYVLSSRGIPTNDLLGAADLTGCHVIRTVPTHPIPGLIQYFQYSQNKKKRITINDVVLLSSNQPLCSSCYYLLYEVLNYTKKVNYLEKGGCSKMPFVFPLPKLATDYLYNICGKKSNSLTYIYNMVHKLKGGSVNKPISSEKMIKLDDKNQNNNDDEKKNEEMEIEKKEEKNNDDTKGDDTEPELTVDEYNNLDKGFLEAAKKGNLESLKTLKQKGAFHYTENEHGNNALHLAAMYAPSGKGVAWLLDQGLPIESKGQNQKTSFLFAAEKGNLPALKILKEKGANVNATDEYGNNALHYAIKNGLKFEIINWLINTAKVPIDTKGDNHQKPPFLMAAEKGNLPALKLLKEKGANVSVTNKSGRNMLQEAIFKGGVEKKMFEWLVNSSGIDIEATYDNKTPFLIAAEKVNLFVLKLLQAKGANVKAVNKNGNNALHCALLHNAKFQVIEWFINTVKISIESKGYNNKTPFLFAAEQGNLNALKFLRTKGANVKAIDEYNNNALHLACTCPNLKIQVVQWLVNIVKLPIDTKEEYYQTTPFLYAASQNNLPVLKFLKDKGANVKAIDTNNSNALHFAFQCPNVKIEVIQWLVNSANLPIDTKEEYDQKTPFLYAAQQGNLPVLKFFKDKDVNVNAIDGYKQNALHLALYYGSKLEIVKWLINTINLPINSKDEYQQTPFLCAAQQGNLPILKFLKNKGANVKVTNLDDCNALHLACQCPNVKIEVIQWLVNTINLPINSKDEYQQTPFLCAAQQGNLPILKFLKKKGANVKVINLDDCNALHLACQCPNVKIEVIQWLVNTINLPINSKDEYQQTPFLCAAQQGNLPILKFLKNKGANINDIDQYGNNALHIAVYYDSKLEVIQWFINIANLPINSKDEFKHTPFLCAVQQGNLPILKFLKNKGANVNETDQYGNNALHIAVYYDSKLEVIQWLINIVNLPINSKGEFKDTPFLCAAQQSNLPILKFLKAKNANINETDQYGNNALHLAVYYNSKFEVIQWLVNIANLPINSKGELKDTPFLCAAENGNLPVLKFLKDKGANANAIDVNDSNALHLAIYYKAKLEVIQWLVNIVNLPIDTKVKEDYGKTPFLYAAQRGNLPLLKFLKDKGANVKATDKNGNNALYYAKKSNNDEVINWLKNVFESLPKEEL